MGLFSRWTKKESSPTETAAKAPRSETQEVKSATETGRERVEAIGKAARETWNTFKSGLARGGSWLLERAASLGYAAVGGTEKRVKSTVRGIEAGYKAGVQYGSETKQEATELYNSGVDRLNAWAHNRMDDYEAGKKFVGAAVEIGTETVKNWAQRRVEEFKRFKKNLDNTPADATREWEKVKREVIGAIAERFTASRERATRDYANARADMSAAKDSFLGWANAKRAELAGTAELRGEIAALRDQVARQNAMIEILVKMQGASAQAAGVMEMGV
jgi:hypothetical protein